MKRVAALVMVSTLVACGEQRAPEAPPASEAPQQAAAYTSDPHSFANPDEVRVRHVSLELDVDFDAKSLVGTATLDLVRTGDADRVVLDTRDLDVRAVRNDEGDALEFSFGQPDADLGTPLTVELGGADRIVIEYATSPDATALQWLEPRQTMGGEHPFLFSQGQAIHTRSWIPLQDSPGVRVTYDATLRVPDGVRAVMSARNDPEQAPGGEFRFSMPQPVPPYLIALGVGDLEFKAMSERTGVYAEAGILDAAANEFADTEKMMEVTEALYGPYRWERYDLLILPPSFPFGGMENPRLSFITPTVIAGDRSLVALIAHELAHSWSGNLVSNATWRDLWLNEGFTTYLTNRIMEQVYGEPRARMEAALDYQTLTGEFEDLPPEAQVLAIDLSGQHADAVFTDVPYTKGMFFLMWLEREFGRETFDAFLRDYFAEFAFESITTDDFEAYLTANLLEQHPGTVTAEQVHAWIHEPGLPDTMVVPESLAFAAVDAQRDAWLDDSGAVDAIDTDGWTVHEWLHFLDGLPRDVGPERLAALDERFDLTQSKNAMIVRSWLILAIHNRYEPAYPRLREFLVSTGRTMLVRVLYRTLAETGQGDLAREVYAEAKPGYHPITIAAIEPLL